MNLLNRMRKIKISYFLIITSFILFYRCSDGDLDLGEKFVNTDTYTQKIDTVTVELSTIISDSVATSGASSNLVGFLNHNLLGKQEIVSYSSLNTPSVFTWDRDEVYDSVVFHFDLDGYTIGDTTQLVTLNISELSDKIEAADNGGYYSHYTVNYNAEPIATYSFYPRPKREEEHSVRVQDDFAQRIIQFMRDNKNNERKNDYYYETFKGISIWPGEAECALGMYTADTSSYFTIYSHIQTDESNDIERVITLNKSESFQHLEIDDSGIFNIENRNERLSSKETNNVSVLQGTSGYKIRVDIPYLENLKNLVDGGYLVRAILQIEANTQYQKIEDLPTSINIGEVDEYNRITTYLYDSSGDINKGTLRTDYVFNENNYYTFDISTWLRSQLAKDITPENYGFVLDLEGDTNSKTLTYLFANGQNTAMKNTKLITYIYKYDE